MFLSWDCETKLGTEIGVRKVLGVLEEVERKLTLLIRSGGGCSTESLLLLAATIAKISPPEKNSAWKWLRFILPGRGGGSWKEAADPDEEAGRKLVLQCLTMVFETSRELVGHFLAEHPRIAKEFFKGNPSRIPLWFSHFRISGLSDFKLGARALALYALAHRAEVWHLLVWTGRHSQSPIAVATKTHYFCEIDVVRSMENFLEDCPEFWHSNEFRKSLTSGDILSLDSNFFAQELYNRLVNGGDSATEVESILKEALGQFQKCEWANRIVPHLPEEAAWKLLQNIRCDLSKEKGLEMNVRFFGYRWESLEQIYLANLLENYPLNLVQMMTSDDVIYKCILEDAFKLHATEELKESQLHFFNYGGNLNRHEKYMRRLLNVFTLQLCLENELEKGKSTRLKEILDENGIKFSYGESEGYELLSSSEESLSKASRKRRKKNKHKKRKKKKYERMEELHQVWTIHLKNDEQELEATTCNGEKQVVEAIVRWAKNRWMSRK